MADRMVFGSDPADLLGCGSDNGDLLYAQDTSESGQFAHQLKFRVLVRGAALKGVAGSKLRRLLRIVNRINAWMSKLGIPRFS